MVIGLVVIATSDAESGTDFEDEDDIYSKLTRSERIEFVKELLGHYQTRSKDLK